MTQQLDNQTLYLKRFCPFCLKLRIFLTEANAAKDISYVIFDDDDEIHQEIRAQIQETGQKPTFPALGLPDGSFLLGTDDLISRFAAEADADTGNMPLLAYYSNGVFKKYIELFMELQELKSAKT